MNVCFEPELMKSSNYPDDVKKRAKDILNCCQGCSVGSYTDSAGLEVVRRQVADFITKRDNIPSNWENIYITAGASPAIKTILSLMKYDKVTDTAILLDIYNQNEDLGQ